MLVATGSEPTARTRDAAGRPMVEEVGRPVGRVAADGAELVEVVGTADDGDRQLVDEQERGSISVGRLEDGPTRSTRDRRLLGVGVRPLSNVSRNHSVYTLVGAGHG